MKKIILIIGLVLVLTKGSAQSTDTFTTDESFNSVSTSDNSTIINLFSLDFNDAKIPISLTYSHDGVKVNDKPNSLGLSWQLNNLGFINRIVNDELDNTLTSGWFNSMHYEVNSSFYYDNCSSDCPEIPVGFLGPDLSPDFFSVSLPNMQGFNFCYKKNILGNIINAPIPVILSNNDSFKINTNFSYFIQNSTQTPNGDVVFNILDKQGINYNFINGPVLQDINRSSNNDFRNNFYLKSIVNPNKPNDNINVEYITKNVLRKEIYDVGLNWKKSGSRLNPLSPQDIVWNTEYGNHMVKYPMQDYYFVDESVFLIKKITSNNAVVDFIYNPSNYLIEINIKDLQNNYVQGYKFEYNSIISGGDLLWKIEKYDKNKTNTHVVYEFEYYDGLDFISETGMYKDSFGYFNNANNQTLYPFPLKRTTIVYPPIDTVYPAANRMPDLNYAKHHSLFKIKNKFGGQVEFDYRLNKELSIYGGGLLVSSKKEIPNIGKTKFTQFDYQQLMGYNIDLDRLPYHYILKHENNDFFSTNFVLLDEFYQDEIASQLTNGNYFKYITESCYDFDSMSLEYKIVKEYQTNPEELRKTPILKKESYINSSNQVVKVKELSYSYNTIETINASEFNREIRSSVTVICILCDPPIIIGGTQRFENLSSYYFPVIRNVLTEEKTHLYFGSNVVSNTVAYGYDNLSDKRVKKVTKHTSTGDLIEEDYFYATNIQMMNEPYVGDLVSKNIIGSPLKTEIHTGTEKIAEQKTVYDKDILTNFLLPKFEYTRKGVDSPTNPLVKKVTYDKYDTNGKLLQYTLESGVPVSIIWGYNKTQTIASIENIAYATIPIALIIAAQTASNANDETNLLIALDNIRNSTVLSSAMTTSFTYKPSIGISTITDPKGDKITYEYDEFNRHKLVRDKNGSILSENEYHN